jgi:multidrug resistance efflux pump
MTRQLILRVDPETHRLTLERARATIKEGKDWLEQFDKACGKNDYLYEATPIAQYRARKRAERDQKANSST